MSIKFLGWGRWGDNVLNSGMKSGATDNSAPVRIMENDLDYGHFPDALSADTLFTAHLSRFISPLSGGPGVTRVHFVNIGENFSSGALGAFLRESPAHKETIDIVVAYAPPSGTNSAAAGRFLGNAFGRKKFCDLLLLLDGCSGYFCDYDEHSTAAYAAGLGEVLVALERSGCFLPLLLRMREKVISVAFSEITPLTVQSSLWPLWQNISIASSDISPDFQNEKEFLAFSTSITRHVNLASVYERNFSGKNFLYLSFPQEYEWRDVHMPSVNPAARVKNFTGIFCSGLAPKRFTHLLLDYYDTYWPCGNRRVNEETLEPAVMDWLMRVCRVPRLDIRVQDIELLKNAFRRLLYDF